MGRSRASRTRGLSAPQAPFIPATASTLPALRNSSDDAIISKTLDGVITLPTTNPTSITFGGDGGGDLYITSSWFDVEPASRADQPLAGAIFRSRPGVTGRPSPRFADLPSISATDLDAPRPGKGDNP